MTDSLAVHAAKPAPDLTTVTAEVDKVLRIQEAAPYLAHIEFQSSYETDMDERVRYGRPAGQSRTGRLLFHCLRAAGAPALVAGSSDWVVSAGPDGNYPGDEAYFLRSILNTIQNALQSRQDRVAPADLADWLAVRGRQLAAGELVYIAHQLDFTGRSSG